MVLIGKASLARQKKLVDAVRVQKILGCAVVDAVLNKQGAEGLYNLFQTVFGVATYACSECSVSQKSWHNLAVKQACQKYVWYRLAILGHA